MSKTTPHTPVLWLSAQQLIKYVKGNLLGDKKKDVDELTAVSPLLADALEGVKMMEHPERMERTTAAINRQIQLRSGAGPVQYPSVSQSIPGRAAYISIRPYATAAAALALVAVASFTVWLLLPGPESKRGQAVVYEEQATVQPGPDTYAAAQMPPDTAFESALQADSAIPLLAYDEPVARPAPTRVAAPAARETTTTRHEKDTDNHNAAGAYTQPQVEEDISMAEAYQYADEPGPILKAKEKAAVDEDLYDEAEDGYTLAKQLLAAGSDEEATRVLRKVAGNRKSAHREDAAWDLAQLYLKKGDANEAKKWLKKLKNSESYSQRANELLSNP